MKIQTKLHFIHIKKKLTKKCSFLEFLTFLKKKPRF